MLATGDANPPIVEIGAAPARRRERIVADRIVDNALGDDAFVRQCDRYAVLRKPVEEVGRSVQWIDNPEVLGIDILVAARSFLGEDRMGGISGMQSLDDRAFGLAIHFADEILGTFRRDRQEIKITRAAIDDVAGAAGSLHRDREHWMHGMDFPGPPSW